jgi:hypothetical protein
MPIIVCQMTLMESEKAARTTERRGSSLFSRGEKVNLRGGDKAKRRDIQSLDIRNSSVGDLTALAKLRSELDGEEVGKFVLKDGRANCDTEDLAEATDETVEGHLREGEGGLGKKDG